MGDDMGSGLLSMAVCFDFHSTNIVQLSNWDLCWFWCHHPFFPGQKDLCQKNANMTQTLSWKMQIIRLISWLKWLFNVWFRMATSHIGKTWNIHFSLVRKTCVRLLTWRPWNHQQWRARQGLLPSEQSEENTFGHRPSDERMNGSTLIQYQNIYWKILKNKIQCKFSVKFWFWKHCMFV